MLFLVCLTGTLLSWRAILQTDRTMREQLLLQTRMVAQAVPYQKIQCLAGTAADLSNPVYLELKEHLMAVRTKIPLCQSVYLLGRNDAGKLFFYMDSEPVGSGHYSPPGQPAAAATANQYRAFSVRREAVDGPFTEGNRRLISGMVPILDPETALYGLPTPDDAKELVRRAAGFYWKNGRKSLLNQLNNPSGAFCKGADLYAFAYDRDMTCVAHPVIPDLVGRNLINQKDWSGGKYFRKEMQQVALSSAGKGWVEYEYTNANNGQRDLKTTYVEGVDDLILCAGAYKGDGKILGVLGMDLDAQAWNWLLFLGALPALLMTGGMVLVVCGGSMLLARREEMGGYAPVWMRRIEPVLAGGVGLILTLFFASMCYRTEIDNRSAVFNKMAADRTQVIAETFRDTAILQIEGFAHFYEHNKFITDAEFQKYTSYLVATPEIQECMWIPAVRAGEKESFEQEVRSRRGAGFEVWQSDGGTKRVPAHGREIYYPILQVAPVYESEKIIGCDVGSDRVRSNALEEAIHTGLPSGTDPVTLSQNSSHQKGMLIYCPIFAGEPRTSLRGVVGMSLRIGAFLRNVGLERSVAIELALLKKEGALESLAVSWNSEEPPERILSLNRPVFAFGKVFSATAYAGSEFMHLYHPLRAVLEAVLTGFLLTLGLVLVISLLLRQRERLEQLVLERTAQVQLQVGALNAAANAIVITNRKGTILWVNSAFTTFTGYTAKEAIGGNPSVLKSGQYGPEFYKGLWDTVLRGEVWRGEMVNRRKDGNLYTEEMTITPIKNEAGDVTNFIAVKQNITEQRRVEAELKLVEFELRQAQKMESIGNMAAGIAHEINTPVQFVLNNVGFLGDAFSGFAKLQGSYRELMSRHRNGTLDAAYIDSVEETEKEVHLDFLKTEIPLAIEQSKDGVNRVKKIVRAMKEFSHPSDETPALTDINKAISSTLTVCRSEWKHVAEMVTYLERDLPLVPCFSGEINQVVLNLVVNAAHSIVENLAEKKAALIASGGSPGAIESAKGTITVTTHRNDDWVEVQVGDTGNGIPESVQAHVFDPFFTTKGVGQGSGLGLSIAHGIIEKKHKGKIGFISRVGLGTTFFFRLPLTRPEGGIEKQKQFY